LEGIAPRQQRVPVWNRFMALRQECLAGLPATEIGAVEGVPQLRSATFAGDQNGLQRVLFFQPPEEGRFPAGTVLAGRYRILGLLGQGGMGEVYRAYDLILNQAVAFKLLAAPQLGEAALTRFRNEVRIARQVSISDRWNI
jgi:hypothetical protein